jgi:hypothetical protein
VKEYDEAFAACESLLAPGEAGERPTPAAPQSYLPWMPGDPLNES